MIVARRPQLSEADVVEVLERLLTKIHKMIGELNATQEEIVNELSRIRRQRGKLNTNHISTV